MAISLVDIVDTWLKNSDEFKDHYRMTFSVVGGVRLDWIECKCKYGVLPPTPNLDIIVAKHEGPPCIDVWVQKSGQQDVILATDPEMFEKLAAWLRKSH